MSNNYKIKYSNDSLSHHGILGMKWGVWNDETAARYRGEKRRPSIDAKSSKVLYESTNRYDLKKDSGTYKGKQINTVHIKNKDNGKEIEITEESLANLIQNDIFI